MSIEYDLFCEVCPSAATPSLKLYGGIAPFVDEALRVARGYYPASDMSVDVSGGSLASLEPVARHLAVLACVRGYRQALPHLDLVLTSTGFGVVSNENVAPASRERVEALRAQLYAQEARAHDMLLEALSGTRGWHTSVAAQMCIGALLYKCGQLGMVEGEYSHVDDLPRVQSLLFEGEMELWRLMSYRQYQVLLDALRGGPGRDEPKVAALYGLCLQYVLARHRHGDVSPIRGAILECLESDTELFAAYAASAEYRANHYKGYENGKDDPCYFFGQ